MTAQQTFVFVGGNLSSGITGKRLHVDLKVLGGFAVSPLTAHVCIVDKDGNLKRHFEQTFNGAVASTNQTFTKRTFGKATGLRAFILLEKPVGPLGYRYRISCSQSG